MNASGSFPMPESSWEGIKKILRGYRAVQTQESPTVEGIAKLAGIHRPILSMNNNFLREIGVVQPDKYKLTEVGTRLAGGIAMNSPSITASAINVIVLQNAVLNTLYGMLTARGGMTTSDFKAELMLLVGLNERSRQLPFVKTILDMFQEGGLVTVDENVISLTGDLQVASASRPEISEAKPVVQKQAPVKQSPAGVPLALGPNRVAYVVLPDDWNGSKDLKKFLKLAELALGEGSMDD